MPTDKKSPISQLFYLLSAIYNRFWAKIAPQLIRFDLWTHRHHKKLILVGGTTVSTIWLVHMGVIMWPRSVQFDYTSNPCFFNPVLMPNHHEPEVSDSFSIRAKPAVRVGNYPVVSTSTCVEAIDPPKESQTEELKLKLFGLMPATPVRVSTAEFPNLDTKALEAKLVSTKDPLVFELDQPDSVFSYTLYANDKSSICVKQNQTVSCDTALLGLKQSKTYSFKVDRSFQQKYVDTVIEATAKTVDPIKVKAASIANNSVVFTKPTSITFTLSKPIGAVDSVSLTQAGAEKSFRTSVVTDGKKVTIKFADELPRQADFTLRIGNITATDNGFLPDPYKLKFTTSGGPEVIGGNIPSYGVSTTQTFVLNLDSAPEPKGIAGNAYVMVGSKRVAASVRVTAKSISITPSSALPRCSGFSVHVSDSLHSVYGITGGSGWSMSSRTICGITQYIGSSVHGRGILAYRFGTGSSKVIYVGNMHGNESSSKYTLDAWVQELERNYHKIPSNRTIIVIPNVNPDGFAVGSRYNANGVDLNRNFPANDWSKQVSGPGGSTLPEGGGKTALSEPESSALASFVLAQNPRLVLTYHAVAGVVIGNGSGDSGSLAGIYAQKAGYSVSSDAHSDSIFGYATTGEFEDWLHDKHGIPALLIELGTMNSNEFYRNYDALWHMAGL